MTRCAVLLAAAAQASLALGADHEFPTPSDDRWHYPFNFTPGIRPIATCFSSVGNVVFPAFNDRDGVFVIAWNTGTSIEPGSCPLHYDMRSVRVILTNDRNATWAVDPTADEWFTFDFGNDGAINADGVPRGAVGDTDGESDDADSGRPLELFGAGFGPVHSYAAWVETSFYVGADQFTNDPRDPFPFVYQDGAGARLHVEDSVKGTQNENLPQPVFHFTPASWAIGVPVDYTPGGQNVPFDVAFDVDLALSDGAVRRYFQEQLGGGRVFVIVTSLAETIQFGGGPGTIPTFFTKEGVNLHPLAKAPRLIIRLGAATGGDADNDCDADLADHAGLIGCFAGPFASPSPPLPVTAEQCRRAFDFDGDDDVDASDVGTFSTVFTGAP